ncbi:MAG TPA: hypothetical protein PKN32_01415 [Bacteroidales bacterium]|nr:hypothetical protein [Bacteroidales bacterium]
MKKIILLIYLAIICSVIVNAQSSTSFGYDKEIVLDKLNDYVRLFGADSDGFYALRINERDELYLDFFNGHSMTRESTNQLILPMIEGIQSEYLEMFYLDGKLVLFTQVINNTVKEKSLYIQHVNKSGQIIGEPIIIGKLTNQNIAVNFNVVLTPNQQNIFVYYNRPFQTYNEEPFFFKVYNADLKEIYNHQVKLPLVGDAFEIDQIEIANSGNVFMLARISPDPRQLKRMKTIIYDYKLLIFEVATGIVTDVEIKGKKFILVDAIFGVDENENVDIFGFMVRKGKDNYEGIFHQRYDTKLKQFVAGDAKKADYIFSKTEIPEFRADRLMKVYTDMYNYKLLDVLYLSNGGSVVISEHYNYWSDSIIVPGSKEIIYNDYYRFNDVLVAYCSPENAMEWMTRIPKAQYSFNDLGKFSSVAAFAVGEKVFLFYNDNPKNHKMLEQQNLDGNLYKEIVGPDRKGVATVVSIFSDGKVHGTAMFNKKNKKYRIVPELFKEYDYRYYLMSQSGAKIKFAMFTGK